MLFSRFERMVAWRYLRARRKEGFVSVIAGFSFLGIALGVATLIIVMAVMNGFRGELLGRILGINAHMSVAYHSPIEDYLPLKEALEKIDGVVFAAPIIHGQVLATANEQNVGAYVRGIRKQELLQKTLLSDNIIRGSLDHFGEGDAVVIGARMAESMRLRVGDTIRLISPQTNPTILGSMPRLKDYTVSAIFEIGMFEYDSSVIFMPLRNAQTYFRYKDSVSEIEIEMTNPEELEALKSLVREAIDKRYRVVDWQEANGHFFNSLKVERNVMFLILTLIIVVAAFNIISGMVMMVTDKGREIAILRTMGASRGSVMRIFFLAGSMIGVTGTLLGLLLGVGFAENIESIRQFLEQATNTELFAAEIYFLSQLPADVELENVLMVTVMALGLSFLATLYPAWRAARVDPVEGLRYE